MAYPALGNGFKKIVTIVGCRSMRHTMTIPPENRLAGLSSEDVLIVSFPKTGSTFTRFVFANVVYLLNKNSEPVDFYNLGQIMPECLKDNLIEFCWKGDPLPRLVKTHQLAEDNPLYAQPKALYVLRDPRDTMISFYYYASKRKKGRFEGTFDEFVENNTFGIDAYNKHIESWYSKASWVFDYETLMKAPLASFLKVFDDLGINIQRELLQKALLFSQPDKLKAAEKENSRPNHSVNFDEDFTFVRNASIAQWKDKMSPEQATHIWDRSSAILKARYERY